MGSTLLLIVLPFIFGLGLWAYDDARQLRERGAKVIPWLWGVLVVLAPFIAGPVYVALRYLLYKKQVRA